MNTFSVNELAREYTQIGQTESGGQPVLIYLHNDKIRAVAVLEKTRLDGNELRHETLASVDLYIELAKRTKAVLSVVYMHGRKDMGLAVIDALDAAGYPVLLDMPLPPLEVRTGHDLMINGHPSTVTHDPEINMYRGEFLGLNGGADFYADTKKKLVAEGETSLRVFLEICARDGLPAYKEIPARVQVLFDDDEEYARRWMYSPCRALDWKMPAEVSHDELCALTQKLSGEVLTKHEQTERDREIEMIMTHFGDVIRALADR
ncbi:TPA: type II toxin-antitoxin system HicB family antitoxin [Enterobacter hormaechei subsp. xiangfangensis]|nr:type II toxin-antitoxin system HicB family antitoxin [Enterobacter hormaechei subsp. xiangfangensis]